MSQQTIIRGDCLVGMTTLEADSIGAIITDPPYHLTSIVERFGDEDAAPAKSDGPTGVYARAAKGFMGQTWDGGDIAFHPETWAAAYRVLRPGGYLLCFGGTRTFHRMAMAISRAGFKIEGNLSWCYGTGFPKSHNVAIGIDKAAGAMSHRGKRVSVAGNRSAGGEDVPGAVGMPSHVAITDDAKKWQGWGTALKPAWEVVVVARKPGPDHGVQIEGSDYPAFFYATKASRKERDAGLDTKDAKVVDRTGMAGRGQGGLKCKVCGKWKASGSPCVCPEPDFETVAFDRPAVANNHPTVKPINVMEWCVKIAAKPGDVVLDPFMGSGTTGIAAVKNGCSFVGMEQSEEYAAIAEARIRHHGGTPEVT